MKKTAPKHRSIKLTEIELEGFASLFNQREALNQRISTLYGQIAVGKKQAPAKKGYEIQNGYMILIDE